MQCKTDKSILNNTEKKHYTKIPEVPSKSAVLFWLDDFPVVRSTQKLGYSYMYTIDAVTKS